ncbi:probable pectinesterase/pectinesterase inhibitor 36 [Cornus florida]|uniref:probable pectinesterase/pectinesterase inhibitor 36 n=1 Tax=Cornus florida TaxID=4283 RepID=UPI0028A19E1E|nr:probable pectinesterase/pectinesterase inhibitor 36 [Cornus florida]
MANLLSCNQQLEVVQMARAGVLEAMNWARANSSLHGPDHGLSHLGVALSDCVELYEETKPRLARLLSGESYSREDALAWLSGALASHRTCLDGLEEKGWLSETHHQVAQNLTVLLRNALAFYGPKTIWRAKSNGGQKKPISSQNEGLLASWNAATSINADFVVAKDGSGNFRTINEAVAALARMAGRRRERVIIYVKSGVYNEKVKIRKNMKNVMFVGDGMDKTIVTGNQSVQDGASTLNSATFGVSGDGFWARDMTFENTGGPQKHQAVALRVSSDLSIFYRCSFKGYQDTLYVHSQRQFYRDCHIYGTVDFIFGDATAVLQNCDIYVRRPLDHQSNMITAQARDDPDETTGISILNSIIAPAPEFGAVKGRFKSYLGRPWRRYSRTVFLKTDMDGLIDPKGWTEWRGNFGLSTLYYGEYMNSGSGASTAGRVRWPGFHVLKDPHEASPFTVRNFIQGHLWIPVSGVPFLPEI